MSTNDHETAPELPILQRIRQDADTGRLRPLVDYIALSPSHQVEIARAYLANFEPLASKHPSPGMDCGHYRLLEQLGQGGQATVWLAEDKKLGRRVALKVFRSLGSGSPQVAQRFRREAEITSRLEHPGICPIYDAGFEGTPWIAMRYVEGETLASVIGSAREDRFGIHDTHGNVEEWCSDFMSSYDPEASRGVMVEKQRLRTCRGGSFRETTTFARSAYRGARSPEFTSLAIGFRVARDLEK